MDRSSIASLVMIVSFLALFGVLGLWWFYGGQVREAEQMLHEWAVRNDMTVLDTRKANPIGTGPAAGQAATDKRVVLRVRLRGPDGTEREIRATIGSKTAGVLEDLIEVTPYRD